nr:MobH family relaxase [uncultured Caldimonas sp.]
MLSLLRRKSLPNVAPRPDPPAAPGGLLRPQTAAFLLATPRRQKLLEHIWQRTSLSRKQFHDLYRKPLERYAELVQLLPASESHHHAYPGGLLDHGLEIVAYALKLRQSYLLPIGSAPETQAAQGEAWSAAAAYGALLHDIGKIATDLHVEHDDGSTWHPWHGPVHRPYRFRFRKGRQYRLHTAAAGLLYTRVLDRSILDWLSTYPELWSALLFVLAGQYEHAGVLGELVGQADQASVAQAMGGDPAKALAAPKQALQRKLIDGLRYLLKEELKLNQPEASDGWLTSDGLWLVSKTVADKLRAHLLSQGIDGIPQDNITIFNVMQEHAIAQPSPDGKAIWKATVTGENGWSHSFTFLKLSPALIWGAAERPEVFAGSVAPSAGEPAAMEAQATQSAPFPSSSAEAARPPAREEPASDQTTSALLDLLQPESAPSAQGLEQTPDEPVADEAACLPPKEATSSPAPAPGTGSAPSGEHFLSWLRQGIQLRTIVINDVKALLHTVAGTAYLVTPGLFQRYAQEHPRIAALAKQEHIADWQWVQRRFERLRLHRKQGNGLNIWTCQVTGPRRSRQLHGYLLADASCLFDTLPVDNPYLTLPSEAKPADTAGG